jgi:3-phosphoshikimate 1-carboxyvinyltransferase
VCVGKRVCTLTIGTHIDDCNKTTKTVEQLPVAPVRVMSGTVKLPGSKSLSNRILLLAALAEGTTLVRNLLVRSGGGCGGRWRRRIQPAC